MNFDVKLDPQSQLIDCWKRWFAFSLTQDAEGELKWGDVETRTGNSVADAEMIEVLLLSGSQNDVLDISTLLAGSEGSEAILDELRSELGFGKEDSYSSIRKKIFSVLIRRLDAYFSRYLDESKPPRPVFSAPGYLETSDLSTNPEADLKELSRCDMVDGFSLAISVCVQTLRLLRNLRVEGQLDIVLGDVDTDFLEQVESKASVRLTAAMEGLCDSFSVVPFKNDEWEMCLRETKDSAKVDFVASRELDSLRRSLNLATIGDIPNDRPWECGFSWARVRNVETGHGAPALDAPYLYSTIVALDGILDVADPGVMASGLLSDEQAALATKLSFFSEITRRYWTTLAFMEVIEGSRWRIEDTPWRSPDADEGVYLSLGILRLIASSDRLADMPEEDAGRLIAVIEDLGIRARITRAPFQKNRESNEPDPALDVHYPGRIMEVQANQDDRELLATLRIFDFVPQFLKVAAGFARIAHTDDHRKRLRRVIEDGYRHLNRRRSMEPSHIPGTAWAVWPPRGLWDDLSRPLDQDVDNASLEDFLGVTSWYFTERAIEALVALNKIRLVRPATPLTNQIVDEAVGEYEWSISQTEPMGRRPKILALDKSLTAIDSAGSFSALATLLADLASGATKDE